MKQPKDEQLKWLGVDLDDTVAHNSGYPDYNLMEPREGAVETLRKLSNDGWKIIIHTSRPWADYEVIESWLNKYNILVRRIVCGKLLVKYFIDDRNIEFNGNWKEVKEKIKRGQSIETKKE